MNDVLYIKASETPLFAWNLRRLLLGCPVGLLKKKTLPFGDVSFGCPVGLLTKKDIAFRRCHFWVPGGTSHKKKTLPFSDVSFGVPGGTRTFLVVFNNSIYEHYLLNIS